MRENLELSLKLMFGDEGGYSNSPTDRGGPTKFGITHKTLANHRGVKSVTAEQVKALTIEEARDIYVGSYWGPSGGDVLPAGLDYAAFDFGVNSGPMTAVKKLQDVLGFKPAEQDGWIGPATQRRVAEYQGGIIKLIDDYCARRMAYLQSLPGKKGFASNGRGWTIRVTGVDPKGEWKTVPGVVGNAKAMAKATPAKPAVVDPTPNPLPANGDAKATPAPPNPWVKPEVWAPLMGGGSLTAVLGFLQKDPLMAAAAVGVLVFVGIGAIYAFKRIKALSA